MRATSAQMYAERLESWEQDAYSGEYGEDWLVEVGESVKWYTEQCVEDNKTPTFAGLMRFLARRKER